MALAWIGYALLSASVAGSPPAAPDVQRQYQEQRAQAGPAPDDQVKLALWCEAHGLPAERLKHLARAVLSDPAHATARGLMGLVEYRGKWQAPEAVADRIAADRERAQLLADYEARRSTASESADGQWRLALWCEEQGLADQARAHVTAVTRLDPGRDAAWKKLGYARVDGRWVTPAQAEANRARAEAQKQADRRWKPVLEKWRTALATPARRAEAEAALLAMSDPLAVPMIAQVFASGRASDQAVAVRVLAQVEGPAASQVLARLAIFSPDAEVRRAATETLRLRDPREFVRLWINLIRTPTHYEVKQVGGPSSPGELLIEGKKADLRRIYSPLNVPDYSQLEGARLGRNATGERVVTIPGGRFTSQLVPFVGPSPNAGVENLVPMLAERSAFPGVSKEALQRAAQSSVSKPPTVYFYYTTPEGLKPLWTASQPVFDEFTRGGSLHPTAEFEWNQQISVDQIGSESRKSVDATRTQLAQDVAALDRENALIRAANAPVVQALGAVTGVSLGDDQWAWSRWSLDQQGYAAVGEATSKPTVEEHVSGSYLPIPLGQVELILPRHSCFAAGTAVRTIQGTRPIESLSVGDSVLVQDAATGVLKYRPIVAVYHNQPNATLRVTLDGGDSVVATGIHRFWKAGQGWAMARELKEGDRVRTLGGVATVRSVAADKVQPVFNLEVAEGASYFVGSAGALVHDNSLVEPTLRPFDAPAGASRADGP